MDIRQLETFVNVAKCKSFSKAAEKLFITQPTVTNHIKNLEMELENSLISRRGKHIELTNEGYVLYEYAVNILNLVEGAKYDLLSNQRDIHGNLTLYASSVPRRVLLADIFSDFNEQYPNISFRLYEKDSKAVSKDIMSGRADFGFLGAKFSDPNLEFMELMEDEIVLVAPFSFPYENGYEIEKSELIKFSWIFREEGSATQMLVDKVLENEGMSYNKFRILGKIEDMEVIKKMIMKNMGCSFLSRAVIDDELELKKLKYYRIKGLSLRRSFYFAYHKYRKLSPVNSLFKEFMIRKCNAGE